MTFGQTPRTNNLSPESEPEVIQPGHGMRNQTCSLRKQNSANELDGYAPLFHKIVVKFPLAVCTTFALLVIVAELVDFKFSQCVIKVRRVVCTTAGLFISVGRFL